MEPIENNLLGPDDEPVTAEELETHPPADPDIEGTEGLPKEDDDADQ